MKIDAVEAVECVKSWRKSCLMEGLMWFLANAKAREEAEVD